MSLLTSFKVRPPIFYILGYLFVIVYIIFLIYFFTGFLGPSEKLTYLQETLNKKEVYEQYCMDPGTDCLEIDFSLIPNPKTDDEKVYLFDSSFKYNITFKNVGYHPVNQTLLIQSIPNTLLPPYTNGRYVPIELGKGEEKIISTSESNPLQSNIFDIIGPAKIIITPSKTTFFFDYKRSTRFEGTFVYPFEVVSLHDYYSSKRIESQTRATNSLTIILIIFGGIQLLFLLWSEYRRRNQI